MGLALHQRSRLAPGPAPERIAYWAVVPSPLRSKHDLAGGIEEERRVGFGVQTLVKSAVERVDGDRERHVVSFLQRASMAQLFLIGGGLWKMGSRMRLTHAEEHEVDTVPEFGVQRINHRHGAVGHWAGDRSCDEEQRSLAMVTREPVSSRPMLHQIGVRQRPRSSLPSRRRLLVTLLCAAFA